jgi:acyl-CoA thioesterase YciA
MSEPHSSDSHPVPAISAVPPSGIPAARVVAMPADTNPNGDIFGGWLLSHMDLAGANVAAERAQGRVVTVAIDGMTFRSPVHVGDLVSFYGEILKTGRTSVRVRVEAWARSRWGPPDTLVTVGDFTYVAIDDERRTKPLPDSAQATPQ